MTRIGILVAAILLAACGDDPGGENAGRNGAPGNNTSNNSTADAGNDATTDANGTTPEWATPPDDCDPLDESYCALPWPSNLYMSPDDDLPTGMTLTFGETTLPANAQGKHIEPGPFRRLDGYGFGTPIMTVFPNVDLDGLASEADIAPSMGATSRSLLLKVTESGLEQVPH